MCVVALPVAHVVAHVGLPDMHFMYSTAQGNETATQRVHMERFLSSKLPDHRTFECVHLLTVQMDHFTLLGVIWKLQDIAKIQQKQQ